MFCEINKKEKEKELWVSAVNGFIYNYFIEFNWS